MRSESATHIGVGFFILLGLGSVLFLVTQTLGMSTVSAGGSFVVQARFDHIGSLKVRAPVAVAGVTIGRVSKITVDPATYQAVVEMQIGSDFDHLPVDTDASVASAGLLGGKYIELNPGIDAAVLKNHDEIELTQSAVRLENLIGKYMLKSPDE
ncbi:MAG: outer membrane lipid asymmetry maintenance protein MlaD [Gammaproteobacteria bacterium]|nr:MAG: outer membrane lipid asymmetry maintenance protein MlaD [Gammaproteobacteria bacterium]